MSRHSERVLKIRHSSDGSSCKKVFCLLMPLLFLVSLILLSFTDTANAERRRTGKDRKEMPFFKGEGCDFTSSNIIECNKPLPEIGLGDTVLVPGTAGCLGIKNIAKPEGGMPLYVSFWVTNGSGNIINIKKLSPGQEKKASFTKQIRITNCFVDTTEYTSGYKHDKNCQDVLKITHNEMSGGMGCGCEHFSCLPSAD